MEPELFANQVFEDLEAKGQLSLLLSFLPEKKDEELVIENHNSVRQDL